MFEDLKTFLWFLRKGPKFFATMIALILRPAGWKSTTLCESLRHGVVPISLSGYRHDQGRISGDNTGSSSTHQDFIFWTIYPLWKRSLSWMEEKERIFELLEDTSLYAKTLSELRVR